MFQKYTCNLCSCSTSW